MVNAYDLSVGVFVRGLTNLKAQLTKAEGQAGSSGEAALLEAGPSGQAAEGGVAGEAPNDLHSFTLAAQVLWAAEGARMAVAQLVGEPAIPTPGAAKSLADLHQHLDATIARLRQIPLQELELGLDRTILIQHRRGSASSSGRHFLVAFAIPHFFYHVTAAYSILRNNGVQLTMADYLGNWAATDSQS